MIQKIAAVRRTALQAAARVRDSSFVIDQTNATVGLVRGRSVNPGKEVPESVTDQDEILSEYEAGRRMLLLAELHAALTALGVRCVLARRHRLVLRYNAGVCGLSGLENPHLHIFAPGGTDIAVTDGAVYEITSGGRYPVGGNGAVTAAGEYARSGIGVQAAGGADS
ncbi:MAG TPA: hypothetical protein VNF47_21985 [Streptosporangiaceae bacterium]|nr:hypothetical protein [Streptosporangiaceae bacterium]